MNPNVFREYDIRGVADRDLGDEFVHQLGRAIATYLQRKRAPGSSGRPRVAVGRDVRTTSERLRAALIGGLTASGADVLDVGLVPTPVLYFAAFHRHTDGAVMITGSHNPPPDNGFKIMRGKQSLYGEEIRALRHIIEAGDYAAGGPGQVSSEDVIPTYLDHALGQLRLGERRCKVVVDAGNGMGGLTAGALYRRMGFDVTELYCEPDGSFPNHHPDPTVEANLAALRERVRAEGAEIGIALDGDADRVGVVDARGRILWGDQLMILLGRKLLEEQPGATFIAEVKCSQALFDELSRAGGKPLMWKVGHSLIKAKMQELGAALGGEMSGHIFFAHRYLGFDDGVYAGARMLELLSTSQQPLSALYDTLPVMVNTPEIRIECSDDSKFAVVERITERLRAHPEVRGVVDVDGVRAQFGDGWGLVRASNTQPALVLRCEAASAARLAQIRALLESEIGQAIGHPPVPASHG